MRRWIATAAAVGALGLGTAFAAAGGGEAAGIEPGGAEFGRFLFFATLEGACEDGLPDKALPAILETDEKGRYRNFVYACPVCSPVVEGLRCYGMRDKYYYSRKGDPLTGDATSPEVAALVGQLKVPGTRGIAIHDLVQRWVRRRMDRLRFDEKERNAWKQAMEIGRKKGMGVLPSSEGFQFKSCPSCDGATGCPFDESK
jgi:hypothetical protein